MQTGNATAAVTYNFQAIILNRLSYAIPAWETFLTIELKQKINAF